MTLKSIYISCITVLLISSCGSDRLDVDISDVKLDLNFVNLDSIFQHSDSSSFVNHHNNLKSTAEEIYNYELGYCLKFGNVSGAETYTALKIFLADKYITRLENEIGKTFTTEVLNNYSTSIIDGFKHLKYHLPSQKMPETVVFMNSLFASNVFSTESDIGIGLERYLGAEASVIKELPENVAYNWEKQGMNKIFIGRDVVAGWVSTHLVEESEGNLAEQIIRWGKVLYLIEAAFPEAEKNIVVRYTEDQFKWATENEYSLWKYLVDDKMLFKTEELPIMNMIKEGPFTPGLPEKGPDRLGQFIGWKMVRKYMDDNAELAFKDLLKIPYNDILQNYEPE